ncbi:hypothetical protein NMU03_10165 [Allocoprobacillus halotolerans]|uniref:Uncharacterized protein n=1 Tax=Allocoprobacillus halotolerans TaxID=2944914 RepID=A0ABY5I238_9FIRM|nr:hypothetical protein [Allocoprobacillus halotolerans]UTY38057.1 hypothetical protein NMU03_10165 [Allocoprobacillus halotolerans]
MAYRIYNRGLAKSQLKKKTWICVMIFMLVVIIGMGLLGFLKLEGKQLMIYLGSIGFTGIMCLLISLYVKINVVDKELKQFQKALEKGYHEMIEKLLQG